MAKSKRTVEPRKQVVKNVEIAEERKTFEDKTFSRWLMDEEGTITVGASTAKIMKGDCETFKAKEIYYGDVSNTWRIIVTTDDRIVLLKSSRDLK